MSLLETSQVFFYISIGICAIVISLIYVVKTIIITSKLSAIINKVNGIIREIEEKIIMVRDFIDSIQDKLADAEFYLDKIKKISEYFTDFQNDDTPKELSDDYEYVVKKSKKKIKRK